MTRGRTRAPALLVVPSAIALVFLTLPLAGLLIRAPWAQAGRC